MKKFMGLLIGVSLVFFLGACGEKVEEKPEPEIIEDAKTLPAIAEGTVESSLKKSDEGIYLFTVKNQTEREIVMKFSSSQRFDFTVKSSDGKTVYQFSSVAMFAQAMGEETVKQGGELSYELNLNEAGLKKGTYTLEAWMTPEEKEVYKSSLNIEVK